jgi:hypothetical protein
MTIQLRNGAPVRLFRSAAAGVVLALAGGATWADQPLVTSSASDIAVNLDIGENVIGWIGPYATAYGLATGFEPTYSQVTTLDNAAESSLPTVIGAPGDPESAGMSLTTGALSASVSGGFLPNNAGATATASASVANLVLQLVLNGSNVITIGGDGSSVSSTSTANATWAGLTASGSTSISGLTLNVLGQDIDLSSYLNPAPNTVVPISGISGLVITLNEQTLFQEPDLISLQTNAIDISFNDLHLDGSPLSQSISGDILIGSSFAEVPEPAAWACMLVGMGALGGVLRSRRRLSASAAI